MRWEQGFTAQINAQVGRKAAEEPRLAQLRAQDSVLSHTQQGLYEGCGGSLCWESGCSLPYSHLWRKICLFLRLPKNVLMRGHWTECLWRHKNLTVLTCPGNDEEKLIVGCFLEPLIVFNYSVYLWACATFVPLEGGNLFLRGDWKPLEFSISITNMESGWTIFSFPPVCI